MEMKLYEIAADLQDALTAEEFDEERLDQLAHAFEQKAGAIVAVSKVMASFVDYCKAEEKRIAEKRKAVENRKQRLFDYLQTHMEATGVAEMTTGTATVKLQKNPPKVVVDNEDSLPPKYLKIIQTTQIDKNAIKDALKAGEEVTGAHLEQGLSLRVK